MNVTAKALIRCAYAGLIIITAILMLGDLRADPPGKIDESAGMVFDPPSKCQAARDKVLYGEWRTDEWTPYIHGLLHTLIQSAVFFVFGSNMITMKFPGAFLSLVALLLIAEMTTRRKGKAAGLVAFLLAAINPVTLAYGRSGLLEPQLIFWVIFSAFALERAWSSPHLGKKSEKTWLLIAGIAASAAFWTKGMGIYFVLAATILLVACPVGKRRNTIYFFIPVLISIILYTGPFMTINKPFFEREAGYWLSRAENSNLWGLWSRQPIFHQVGDSRWLLAFGLLAIPLTWKRQINKTDVPSGLRALGLMILIGLNVTSFMQYRPLRYYVLIFVASIPLAAWLIGHTINWAVNPDDTSTDEPSRRRVPLQILTYILLTYCFNFAVVYPAAVSIRDQFTVPLPWRLGISACLAGGVFVVWQKAGKRWVSLLASCKPAVRITVIGLMWSVIFIPTLMNHITDINQYRLHREHQMYDFSKRLGEEYSDLMIAGTTPTFAGVENKHRLRKVTHYGLNYAEMTNEALTHLLIPTHWDKLAFFRNTFPDTWRRAEVIDNIIISGFSHTLFALDHQYARIDDGRIVNPDRHNPAYSTVVEEPPFKSTETVVLKSASHRLFPDTVWDVPLSRSFRLIDRKDWTRLGVPEEHQSFSSANEPFAWEQLSWIFNASQDTPSYATWAISNDTPVAIVGVRVRSDGTSPIDIQCTWTPNAGTNATWDLAKWETNPDAFIPACELLPKSARSEEGTLRIVVKGDSTVWIDAALFLSEQDWNNLPAGVPKP